MKVLIVDVELTAQTASGRASRADSGTARSRGRWHLNNREQDAANATHRTSFYGSEIVRDIVIGMSDGLTVPFALAAGLSGIANSSAIVITGGLAEIAAGSIAMGLGGYLAAKSDGEHYASEREIERREVEAIPAKEIMEVEQLLITSYGLEKKLSALVANALSQRREAWIDFMMRFELGLEKTRPQTRPFERFDDWLILHCWWTDSADSLFFDFQNGVGPDVLNRFYTCGTARLWVCQGRFTRGHPIRSALQTALIGGLAAAAAFGLAKLISR